MTSDKWGLEKFTRIYRVALRTFESCVELKVQYLFHVYAIAPVQKVIPVLPAIHLDRFSTRKSDDDTPNRWREQIKHERCL